jgi:pimeloyl-ACP methyl ester carboxylesterase
MPTRQGFDYYFGIPYSNDMRPTPKPLGQAEFPHPPLPLVRNETLVREITDLIAALDVSGSLTQIDTPLLLVYGASDAIVKPDQAAQVWAVLPAQAAFHLVPGASHLTMILTPRVLQIVGQWLERTLITTQRAPTDQESHR